MTEISDGDIRWCHFSVLISIEKEQFKNSSTQVVFIHHTDAQIYRFQVVYDFVGKHVRTSVSDVRTVQTVRTKPVSSFVNCSLLYA